MLIREAELKDCQECYELSRVAGLTNSSGDPPKKWWIEAFVKEKQIFFVAEENKQVIGFIIGERTTGNITIFHMLRVKEEYQNKGIGTALLDIAEKECKKRKLKVILTYGYAESDKVLHMLIKRGYEKGSQYYEFLKWL